MTDEQMRVFIAKLQEAADALHAGSKSYSRQPETTKLAMLAAHYTTGAIVEALKAAFPTSA